MPESFKAANSPDLSPDETSKVKYVLSGQPTGWAAMAKEVREFDEEKVKSCKEDIDTLLVFCHYSRLFFFYRSTDINIS
ncbi:hypothetical protein BC629DRAFT_1466084 [Irpex lacteus]|nr:hypothetical protein BC629DRAFT_1466084 [Irpex lacteus]